MQEDRNLQSATISIRIVSIDHYQQPLQNYSSSVSFQAAHLTHPASPKLPVIRIFGSTPANQTACVHIHATRPYLYLPIPEGSPESTLSLASKIRATLETALHAGFPDSDERLPYIADVAPVLRYDIYGYKPNKALFLKLSTFAPQTVTRIASIVAQGGVPHLVRPLPYASHIPYVMQFLVDYSLAGMDYIHLSQAKFRTPLPHHTRPAADLFNAPSSKRQFVHGLDNIRPDLFWPFTVGKRSCCPLEIDAFPEHILNAFPSPPRNLNYSFTSLTLAVLWEEELLRTREYPPREVKPNRSVKAGACLTDEFMRERLVEVCTTSRIKTSPSQSVKSPASESQESQRLGSQKCASKPKEEPATLSTSERDCEVPKGPTSQTAVPSQSFSDVLNFLDASTQVASAADPVEEMNIEQFADDDDPMEGKDDLEGDGDGIARDWADIADCTQHESAADDDRIKAATLRRLDEEGTQRESSSLSQSRVGSKPVSGLVTVHVAAPTQPVHPTISSMPKEDVHAKISSFDEEEAPKFWRTVPNKLHVSPGKKSCSGNPEVNNTGELSAIAEHDLSGSSSKAVHTAIRPAEKPPTIESLRTEEHASNAASIRYKTPFYGQPSDEIKTQEVFGGRIIPVRGSGASKYKPFPTVPHISPSGTALEAKAKVVCPVDRPPSYADLKTNGKSLAETQRERLKNGKMVIDSAGRQVRHESHDRRFEQLTASTEASIVHLGATQEIEDIAPLMDEDAYFTPTSDSEKRDEEHTSQIADDVDSLELNRPMSPKYDEAYQLTVNPIHDSGKKMRKLTTTPRSATKSKSTTPRNSMASATQSTHRNQNIILMSLEILAACYAGKLPDPAQNAILAVSAVTKRNGDIPMPDATTTTIFAVQDPARLDPDYHVVSFESEVALLDGLALHMREIDPDIVVGYETQNASIGYILERSHAISHPFPSNCSRWLKGGTFDPSRATSHNHAAAAYYRKKGADIKIIGRHVLSLWRIVRKEVKLPAYSQEAISSDLFGVKFPKHEAAQLEEWFCSNAKFGRAVRYLARLANLGIAITDKLNIVGRTGELARVFGIDFMSVVTRGSQFRVESMLRRVARKEDFILLAAPREEVFRQPAVEALPLVMEPESALYVDPVIVLDFQSLYPSVVIAHNLCYSTMLGNVNRLSSWTDERRVGVKPQYNPPSLYQVDKAPLEHIFVASNGEMFVDSSVRKGILPLLLAEILETRVMVKKAMKAAVGDESLTNMLNARQFGLKMIANVTYGYTSASFSGRMPCAGLADAIVQCGRDALEEMIRYVEEELRPEMGAHVAYGDTDSLFVQVPGATRDEAFDVGNRIVAYAAETFPDPITLKLEKVYQPCILQTKKRYVGYSYENRKQAVPIFDAKGIETVRRDSCPLVQKALERSIRLLFETKDISVVKRQIQRLCHRLHQDRVPFADYIFRKEVRLGSYKEGHLPPAALVATKAMERDARNVPRHGERIPFVVLYERPGAPLKDCVISPEEFLEAARIGAVRLNTTYYITKQILPALNRIFSLVGVRVGMWYAEMPRPTFATIPFAVEKGRLRAKQSSLTMFYASEKCTICHGKGVGHQICDNCVGDEHGLQAARYIVDNRLREAERRMTMLWRTCLACVGDRCDVKCNNLICPVHDERMAAERKIRNLYQVVDDEGIWGAS